MIEQSDSFNGNRRWVHSDRGKDTGVQTDPAEEEDMRAEGESDLLQFLVASSVTGGLFLAIFGISAVIRGLGIF
ncbi:hypothetical protein [Pasteuria penetrans]|uniref:hypothetical protein n=1 Tax=Pasteuria penetrans TaxID=86005 RepID=UPI000FB52805|nr:hypothetical protein [Pasteuria penetrans]